MNEVNFSEMLRRTQRDAQRGAVGDWQVATDSEGMRHIFVEDPLSGEWFEAYNEGREVCHA